MICNIKNGKTIAITFVLIVFLLPVKANAEPVPLPNFNFNIDTSDNPRDVVSSLQILGLLTILALTPSILIMMTSFTRVIVVLSFVRNALATQQMPPNQVLIGLALFLTFFIMAPVLSTINNDALQPYLNGEINQEQAFKNAINPIREFMLKQTREKDLDLFLQAARLKNLTSVEEIPTYVLIPAFIISELKTAFEIGFILFIPFLVIDMIVASTLMSMGMLMLPPVIISLPFKILLFIMVDGWNLVIRSLIMSFN
ncbi:MAG: flagellar biosynthesis protein FliP [Thermosediminibacterales bacterium]|nr:flagellar biosynthesis protein FliP [Thermosediminibacterales bacterium]